jgi:hypothetical protein
MVTNAGCIGDNEEERGFKLVGGVGNREGGDWNEWERESFFCTYREDSSISHR